MTSHIAFRRLMLALAASAAFLTPGVRGRAQELEYQVKAAFLLNFAKFTEFPPTSFDRPDAPVSICTFGENPFGDTLAATLANERAGGRPLQARTVATSADARGCHIVFVPRSQAGRTSEVAAAVGDRGVVTVGESGSFLNDGGTINLFVEDGRVRFAIQPQGVERRGVRFSSHLLRLARNTPERRRVR